MMNPEDYQFCLDCFLREDPGDGDKPAQRVGADSADELIEQAERLLKGGRFKHLELYRSNGDEWIEIRSWP